MAKKVLIVLVCFVLLLCPLAAADRVHVVPQFGTSEYNLLCGFYGSDGWLVNVLDSQYTYGGQYNPLILACSSAIKWQDAIAVVRWDLGSEVPAGTHLAIQCGGWYKSSYSLGFSGMWVSSAPLRSVADYNNYLAVRSELQPISGDPLRSDNGVYRGRLYSGSYTLSASSRYIYLVFQITLDSSVTTGVYMGMHCNSVDYEGNGDTESGANDRGNSAVDSVMEAINLNTAAYGSALSGLVQAASYNGTDVVLQLPAVKLPALGAGGVEVDLMPASSYDFSDAISMVPSTVLLLVRSLLTAALVWFAVKELVGLIQYFLTLRGGASDE